MRLRLATLAESEPQLSLMLQLAAVLDGSFEQRHMEAVWALLHPEQRAGLGDLLLRLLDLKLLKHLSSSGQAQSGPQTQRRRSSSANKIGHYVFQHLTLYDSASQPLQLHITH